LLDATRAAVALVVLGGRPVVGDAAMVATFRSRGVTPRPLYVDGVAKLADAGLVRRISASPIAEPGVSVA